MLQTEKTRFRHATFAADVCAVFGALFAARLSLETGLVGPAWAIPSLVLPATALAGQITCVLLLWLVVTANDDLYGASKAEGPKSELTAVCSAWLKTMGAGALLNLALWGALAFDVLVSVLVGGLLLCFVRWVRRRIAARFRSPEPSYTLLIGNGEHSRSIANWLAGNPIHLTRILGWLAFSGQESGCAEAGPRLGGIDDLPGLFSNHPIRSVILCPPASSTSVEIQTVLDLCDEAGIPCHFVPGIELPRHLHLTVGCTGGLPDVTFLPQPSTSLRLAAKRILDLVIAGICLVLFGPLMLLVAILIKLQDGGPVLYKQRRVGRANEQFWCFKFRTMITDAEVRRAALQSMNEQDGPVFKIRKDPRVTRFGRFLRKYSIDELPQLFNVLAGHMSMVGPRPPTPDEVERYEWWQRRRVSIRPGITCIWQVWGRNKVSFKRWVEMDLYYIDHWSLWLDVKLMLRTVGVVMRGTGV